MESEAIVVAKGVPALAQALRLAAEDDKLERLDCKNYINEPADDVNIILSTLREALPRLPRLHSLDLSRNIVFYAAPHPLNSHDVESLILFSDIISNSTISHLNLSETRIIGNSQRQLKAFVYLCKTYLTNNCVSFICRLNHLNSPALTALSQAIHATSTLVELDLSCNCIAADSLGRRSQSAVEDFARALSNNLTLRSLNLSSNQLTDEDIATICTSLQRMMQLERLSLADNHCGALGEQCLGDLLVSHSLLDDNHGIKSLDMSGNPLGAHSTLHPLAHGLGASESLRVLSLRNCSLTDVHLLPHFLEALRRNATLLQCDIHENPLTPDEIDDIMAEITANNLLVQLRGDPSSVDANTLSHKVHTHSRSLHSLTLTLVTMHCRSTMLCGESLRQYPHIF